MNWAASNKKHHLSQPFPSMCGSYSWLVRDCTCQQSHICKRWALMGVGEGSAMSNITTPPKKHYVRAGLSFLYFLCSHSYTLVQV